MDFYMKWDIRFVYRKSVEKIEVWLKFDKKMGSSYEDQYTLVIILAQFSLEWDIFHKKRCSENEYITLRSVISPPLPYRENRVLYEIIYKNVIQPERSHITM